jgi:hypothetical protein
MTKPSEFKLNTDYLALAQVSDAEFTAVFPPETFQGGQVYDRTQDFTLTATKGAIDRVLISHNGSDYTVGSALTISTAPILTLFVYRPNSSTLRIRLHEYTSSSSGYAMPMQTIKVKISSFKPPNVF